MDQLIQLQYRTVNFNGSTSNRVVIYKEADGCLRVLDPIYGNAETVPGANIYLVNATSLSNPDLIKTAAPELILDGTLFGAEPAHDWCYYYTKSELARQQTDWKQIIKLSIQAQNDGLSVSMPVENLPFIEAFAFTGDTDMAVKLTERTIKGQKPLCPALYALWGRVSQIQGASDGVESIFQEGCKP